MKEVSLFVLASKLLNVRYKLEYPYLITNNGRIAITELADLSADGSSIVIYKDVCAYGDNVFLFLNSSELIDYYDGKCSKPTIIIDKNFDMIINNCDATAEMIKDDISSVVLTYGKQNQKITEEEYKVIFG